MHAAQKDTDEEEETDRMRLPEAANDNMNRREGSSSSRHASPPKRNKKNAKQVRNRKTFQVPQHVEDWYVLISPPLG